MPYDENSFLQGIMIGRTLRGYLALDSTIINQNTNQPSCWNEEGIYSYFYIQYPQPINTITKGQFTACHSIFSQNGELSITNIQIIDESTIKIVCDISNAIGSWIAITNYDGSFLRYSDGSSIPLYGILFWIDDAIPYNPGYIEEIGILTQKELSGDDEGTISFFSGTPFSFSENITLNSFEFNTEELVQVTYTGGIN